MSTFEWEKGMICMQGEKAHRVHVWKEERKLSVGIEFTHC